MCIEVLYPSMYLLDDETTYGTSLTNDTVGS